MLSWSSTKAGTDIDLTAVADGRDISDINIEHGALLLRFATACAERDEQALDDARRDLAAATDSAFMVDAAAVAANFEMMTRLADGTGSRMPGDVLEARASTIGAMGVADLVSRR